MSQPSPLIRWTVSHLKPLANYGAYIAWAIALISMLVSLYFSEIANLAPCVLCWYQRIAMYPLVAIIGISILRRDGLAWIYSWPLIVIGGAIALYQSFLQWGIIPEATAPCQSGVSCAEVTWQLFGFITIPFGSFMAFLAIGLLLWFSANYGDNPSKLNSSK